MKFSPVIFLTAIKEIGFKKRGYLCPACLMEAKKIARCGVGTGDKTSWPRPVIRGSIGFLCLGQVGALPAKLILT